MTLLPGAPWGEHRLCGRPLAFPITMQLLLPITPGSHALGSCPSTNASEVYRLVSTPGPLHRLAFSLPPCLHNPPSHLVSYHQHIPTLLQAPCCPACLPGSAATKRCVCVVCGWRGADGQTQGGKLDSTEVWK